MTHGNGHCAHATPDKDLRIAILATAGFGLAEVAGGLLTGSLSLLSDAGHMFVDSSSLLLALLALLISRRLPDLQNTFGYHRAEVFAALLNCALLLLVCAGILTGAADRLLHPVPVSTGYVFLLASIGLVVNILVAYRLHGNRDVNMRSAYLHVLGDTLSSLAVMAGAVLIALTGIPLIDPILATAIVILLVAGAWPVLRDSLRILLQSAPPDVDTGTAVSTILGVPGVSGVHHVHLWSLCSHVHVLDAHVVCAGKNPKEVRGIRTEIRRRLAPFGILHTTLECEEEACPGCAVVQPIRGAPCCPDDPSPAVLEESFIPEGPAQISTARLDLRPFTPEDADALQTLANDPCVAAGLLDFPCPYTAIHARAWIQSQAERYLCGEEIAYAITRSSDGCLIGAAGFDRIDWGARRAEVGYWIGRQYWSNGYASETLIALIRAAFTSLDLHRVGARHFVENRASGRVMEKAGMQQEGILRAYVTKDGQCIDIAVWSAIQGDWTPPE